MFKFKIRILLHHYLWLLHHWINTFNVCFLNLIDHLASDFFLHRIRTWFQMSFPIRTFSRPQQLCSLLPLCRRRGLPNGLSWWTALWRQKVHLSSNSSGEHIFYVARNSQMLELSTLLLCRGSGGLNGLDARTWCRILCTYGLKIQSDHWLIHCHSFVITEQLFVTDVFASHVTPINIYTLLLFFKINKENLL